MNGRLILYAVLALIILSGGIFVAVKISQSGIDKIKAHEALSLKPYRDVVGIWTIGYGHVLVNGEWWDEITESFAEELLRNDLAIAEKAVNDFVLVPINQNQYDSLVSFVFNVGVNAFKASTLLRKINNNDPSAADEFLRWKYADKKVIPGLLARRERERDLYLA